MPSIGTIEGEMRMKVDQAVDALKNVQNQLSGTEKSTRNAASATTGLNAGVANLAAEMLVLKEGYGYARQALGIYTDAMIEGYTEIDRFNRLTNTSIETGGKWKEVLERNQMSLDDMSTAFRSLSNNINTAIGDEKGTSAATKAFKTLGITLTEANGQLKDSNTLMVETITALQKVPDATTRNALAQDTLGRSYVTLNKILSSNIDLNKELANAETPYDVEGKRKLDNYNKSMAELNSQVEDLTVNIGEGLIPVLTQMVNGLNNYVAPAVNALGERLEYVGYVTAFIGNAVATGTVFKEGDNPTWQRFLEAKKSTESGKSDFNLQTLLGKINSNQSLTPDEIEWVKKFEPSLYSAINQKSAAPQNAITSSWWQNLGSDSGSGKSNKIPTYITPQEMTKAMADGWKPTQQEIADHLKDYTESIISNQSEEWKKKNKDIIDNLKDTIKASFDSTGTKLMGSADAIMTAAIKLQQATPQAGTTAKSDDHGVSARKIEERESYLNQLLANRTIGTLEYNQQMNALYIASEGKYGALTPTEVPGVEETTGGVQPSEDALATAAKLREQGLGIQKRISAMNSLLQAITNNESGANIAKYAAAAGYDGWDPWTMSWDTVYGDIKNLRAQLTGIMDQYLAYIGSTTSTPHDILTFMAQGGIVTRPTIAMVGEAGAEAVVPLGNSEYGGDITIQVVVPDVGVIGEAVVNKLQLLGVKV